ncbi:recombinase family protein [Clostridium botulinum]|uniref:recombinase family protein n=1 Tax=unclassified Clostridium TaxID=2614128 RepID=UPI0013CC0769|nr:MULTISPECIES: recombinase family protein [unclassified Clostridium]NFG31406.1 recombinase family protein [Clostridium botulinum]NFI02588.1 recombinase family protein [Clostridium botulinum]NFI65009.1 recombinase family protein [Clostridium botulinum]NFJ45501.1 recombinase family protein [Clostridium botulinum]NFJ49125.1 recombinase family protein [Clostridium botulinum]
MRTYGYIRVSSKKQNEERQRVALREYCEENKINMDFERDVITDEQSGKNFKREGYILLKEHLLRAGDTLIIKELDRLGRNMDMIKDEWMALERMGVNLIIIDNPMLSTNNKGDLDRKVISNIVFELMSYMAQKEREKILKRQAEGLAAMPVDRNGKKISIKTNRAIGRPSLEYPLNWNETYDNWKAGEITAVKAMELTGLKKTSFYKLVKQYENK